MDSNWFLVNVPFFILVIFLIIKLIVGVKRGAVKELCSFVSAIIAAVVVLLIGFAIRKYIDQDRIIFIVTLLLLFLMITIYRILSLFFTTLKIIAKLPGVSAVNKVLSIPVVICEVVIVTWTVYSPMELVVHLHAFRSELCLVVQHSTHVTDAVVGKRLVNANHIFV